MFNKPLELVNEQDLQVLIENQVDEVKTLDYKLEGYGNGDEEKREFLRDVTSFANAAGGFIIIGIKEKDGKPINLNGVQIDNIDLEIRRMENILRDGVKPRIPGVEFKDIELKNGAIAIIIRIPKSWASPHMVTFKNLSQFWARNSKGKYQLDIDEIRTAFLMSDTIAERLRNFRIERTSKIIANETPVYLLYPPKIAVHLVPLNAFSNRHLFDVSALEKNSNYHPINPLGVSYDNHKINFDGYLIWRSMGENQTTAYVQVYRNGIIESVTNIPFGTKGNPRGSEPGVIYSNSYESDILKELPIYIKYLSRLGVELPYFIMFSVHGVSGYSLHTNGIVNQPHFIDRDDLIFPEIMIETIKEVNFEKLMKPLFDGVWNAANWSESRNYDSEGKWVGQR